MRKTLNKLSAQCMLKFNEANAKLEQQEKEIARKRRVLNCEVKAAEKPKPRVLARQSSAKATKFSRLRKSASPKQLKKPTTET